MFSFHIFHQERQAPALQPNVDKQYLEPEGCYNKISGPAHSETLLKKFTSFKWEYSPSDVKS